MAVPLLHVIGFPKIFGLIPKFSLRGSLSISKPEKNGCLLFRSMSIESLKINVPVVAIILLITFYALPVPVVAIEKPVAVSSANSTLTGNRFLIVTSNAESGERLAKILQELYGAEVSIKATNEYSSFIDEANFDAFIYYGFEYLQPPSQGFIHDMERTSKPVLWINYHGWALNQKYLSAKGITILDDHDISYTKIEMQKEVFALTPTDMTFVKAKPEKVICYLRSKSGERTPGAVHSDGFTYVAYSPNLDIFSADFLPFLMAIRATFGKAPAAPANKAALNYQERISEARKDVFRTGVHLPVYVASSRDSLFGYEDDKWHENLVRIKQSGAEWVNLVRTFYQTDIRSSDIHADEQLTPRLDGLENIINNAHELGLKIQLHLAINLKKPGPDDWHGMIRPKNKKQWWAAYQTIILEMVEFSKRNEVEALIIGTEYSALQSHEKKWRELIKMIREKAQYPGMLGYGTNFNTLNIRWLDALDFLGISAYWPLSVSRDPDLQTLNQAWFRINKQLGTWMKKHPSLRVEFTEVGYASQLYSSVFPFSWKSSKGATQSLTEQLQSYRALHQFLKREPKIKGVHIFASTAEDDDPASIGYTPFGKPAEKVVKQIMQIR